jgi:hypothetical protein
MLGPVIKNYWSKKIGVAPEDIVMVSVMPCTAKKHEADRPEFETAGPGECLSLRDDFSRYSLKKKEEERRRNYPPLFFYPFTLFVCSLQCIIYEKKHQVSATSTT